MYLKLFPSAEVGRFYTPIQPQIEQLLPSPTSYCEMRQTHAG